MSDNKTINEIMEAGAKMLAQRDGTITTLKNTMSMVASDLRRRAKATPEEIATQVPESVFCQRLAEHLEVWLR